MEKKSTDHQKTKFKETHKRFIYAVSVTVECKFCGYQWEQNRYPSPHYRYKEPNEWGVTCIQCQKVIDDLDQQIKDTQDAYRKISNRLSSIRSQIKNQDGAASEKRLAKLAQLNDQHTELKEKINSLKNRRLNIMLGIVRLSHDQNDS